jgi:Holliday junction resolvasome RuvABC endonuclease subunit
MFQTFQTLLQNTLVIDHITKVAYEDVRRHLGTDAAHVYGGFLAIVELECEKIGISCTGFPVGTIKKHATGKGNATKEMMILAAKKRGWNPVDDNHADALHLLSLALTTAFKEQ